MLPIECKDILLYIHKQFIF